MKAMSGVKRILSMVLLGAMVFFGLGLQANADFTIDPTNTNPIPFTVVVESGTCGENDCIKWSYATDGILRITGDGAIPDYGTGSSDEKAPWFKYGSEIKSIKLEGIQTIGEDAFYGCTSITEVSLPGSCYEVKSGAFFGCSSLRRVLIQNAFCSVHITAFTYCNNLERIDLIAQNQNEIDTAYFYYLTLDGAYYVIHLNALNPNLTQYSDQFVILQCPKGKVGEFTVADGVEAVGAEAFYECSKITKVKLAESTRSIRNSAFDGCSNLKEIYIPAAMECIDPYAFRVCTALKDVYYGGTEQQWNELTKRIYMGNDFLLLANVHFNSDSTGAQMPTQPSETTPSESQPETGSEDDSDKSVLAVYMNKTDGTYKTGETIILYVYLLEQGGTQKAPAKIQLAFDQTALTLLSTQKNDNAIELRMKGLKVCDTNLTFTETASGKSQSLRLTLVEPEDEGDGTENMESMPSGTDFDTSNKFSDVPWNSYCAKPVEWAVSNGITKGTGKNQFSPDRACTRAEIVTFLWRAAGSPEPKNTKNIFTDVPSNAYYKKAVLWAVEEGVTSGVGKNQFSPSAVCTRAQAVTFLHRYAGYAASSMSLPYRDVPDDAFYTLSVRWALENNITSGTGKTTFSPDKPCTRGEIVTFLYRNARNN